MIMKFGKKKKRSGLGDQQQKVQARKKIWEDPSLVENLFKDEDWKHFDANETQKPIPGSKMAKHIRAAIDQDQVNEARDERRRIRNIHFYRYAVAASMLLLFTFSIWKLKHVDQINSNATSIAKSDRPRQAKDSLWIAVTNTTADIKVVVLPDESTAKLFANTQIRYKRGFTATDRAVYLEGKAYFSVQRDPARPFSVYTKETKTTALGTSFTIDSHSGAKYASVQLHTGKVVVASLSETPTFQQIFLDTKGERLLFDANKKLVAHRGAKPKENPKAEAEMEAPSATNLLRLENIPLNDVFTALHNVYGVNIHGESPQIAQIHYTAVIDPQVEELADILAVICLINDLRYVIEEDGSYSIYTTTKDIPKTEQTN